MPSLQDEKREYLRRSVDRLKKEKGYTQRSIAEKMDETEQELSGKLSEKSKRGITDEYIDRFAEVFGLPFGVGSSPAREALLERIAKGQEEQAVLLQTLAKLVLAKLG